MLKRSLLATAIAASIPICMLAAQQANAEQAQSPLPQSSATTGQSKRYAQELLDRTAARHPELLELDLHAIPPDAAESVIIASRNAARIGTKSDRDDVDVIKTGTPFVEINRAGDQNVEVHIP